VQGNPIMKIEEDDKIFKLTHIQLLTLTKLQQLEPNNPSEKYNNK
jgi:hypothetical protein